MTNADKFKETFDIYATELWAMSEADFIKWLNADHKTKQTDLVRCGECAWYEKPYCRWHNIDNKPTDFCSYGERRNDE